MEAADHLLELEHLRARFLHAGVGRLGREEAERIVPPIVLEPLACLWIYPPEVALVEFLDRHQFHGSHAEVFQIRYLLDQTAIRPWKGRSGAGMSGVTAHMEFIDDRRFPGTAEWLIALPIKIRVRDDALRRAIRIVGFGEGQILLRRRRIVPKGGRKSRPATDAIPVA